MSASVSANPIAAPAKTRWPFAGGLVVLIAAVVKLVVHLYAGPTLWLLYR
jgi:hypothetical protein